MEQTSEANNVPRKFLDSFLSSPIIRNERDRMYAQILAMRAGEKIQLKGPNAATLKILAKASQKEELLCLEPENYQWLTRRLDSLPATGDIKKALGCVARVANHTDTGLGAWGLRLPVSIESYGDNIRTTEVEELYKKMRFWEDFINKVGCSRAAGGRGLVSTTQGGLTLLGNEYIVMMKDHSSQVNFLLAYNQCLMLKDMYYGRMNTITAGMCIYPGDECLNLLKDCFNWTLECLEEYGNKGYELVKAIEPLAKTNLTRKAGGVFSTDGPHEKMLGGIRTKEGSLGGEDAPLTEKLEEILRKSRDLQLDVEIFGLQKLSGHPLVDPYTGGKKVRETSRRRIKYRPAHIQRVRNNFCRMYLEGFVRKKSAWPPLVALEGARDTRLYQLMVLNELRLHVGSYPLEDWNHFKFGKHHEFDYYPNFLDLMDDKSISYYRDQFMATWDSTIRPRSHKRLLIEMLSRPDVTIRDIVERVRRGDIPFSWLIVSLYPKEREFKLDPRMFGMMVFEMRAFFTCTESNISTCIFPNLPPQTMTLSKIEIQELFQEVTADHGRSGGVRLYEEFDLSGWNGHFHDEIVDPIAMDMEDMFGLPGVFTVIHHFFKECIMSVRVKECPPDNGYEAQRPGRFPRSLESSVLWPDHDAGIEGLAQKIWTPSTFAQIDLGMQDFGVKYYIIGQSDNQTVTAWVPDELSAQYAGGVKELALKIAQAVERECQRAGHELNLDECLYSTEVITYSKEVYVRGTEYYTSLKAFSRVFPHSASDFPSVINSVGAIAGQCLGAAERCKDSLKAYWLSLFHTSLYLLSLGVRKPVETTNLPLTMKERLTPGLVSCLMEYPGEMGGLPIGHILGFLYKGGADPLSKAVGSCKVISRGSRNLRRVLFMLKEYRWFEKTPEKSRLLDDPYSLPLKSPRSPEMSILADSVSRVKGLATNRDIYQMISMTTGEYESQLRSLLSTPVPLNPVLAADMLGLSLVGVARTALKMFTSTQTIQSLLQGDSTLNPCQRILSTGASQFHGLIMRMERVDGTQFLPESAYQFTRHLRKAWTGPDAPELIGITVVTPVDLPLSYSEPPSDLTGFKVDVVSTSREDLLYTRGPKKVYFGRATREHRSEHGYRIITSSSPEIAVSKLAKIATQPGIGEGMLSVLEHITSTRGNISLRRTLPFLGSVYGGMVGHRYQTRLGNLSANIMGVAAQASHCTLSTDTAQPISGGEEDYPCMVQEHMVALLGLVSWTWPFPSSSCSLTLRTDTFKWESLIEAPIEVENPKIPHNAPMTLNPLVYAEEIVLERSVTRCILPMISLMPVKGRESKIPYHACSRRIWRHLNRSHAAAAVADRGAGRIHLDLDIAEVARLGGSNTVKLAALAVAQFAVDALFSRSEGEFRWTPLPVLMSLARAISASLAVYLRHPMVQATMGRRDHLRDSGMTYQERRTHLEDKVGRLIIKEGLTLFNDPSSLLYESPIVMFYDDPEGEAWRSLAHVYKRSCLQAAAVGEIPMSTAYILVRRNLTASVMGKRTDLGRSQRMARLIGNSLTWAKDHTLPQLTSTLSQLSKGLSVVMTQCALSEALRLARRLSPTEPRSLPFDAPCLGFPAPYEFQVLGEVRKEPGDLPNHDRWQKDWNRHAYDLWTIGRLKGRKYGLESSVGYSYVPLISKVQDKGFVSVGCGHGAGAAVLLVGGANMCYGLDLKEDITPEARMTGQHTPLHIRRLHLESCFLRLGWSLGWDGDITDRQAVRHLTASLSGGLIWICDVPLHSLSALQGMMWTIRTVDPCAQVFVRVLGSSQKVIDTCTYGFSVSSSVTWIPVHQSDGFCEGWVEFVCAPQSIRPGRQVFESPGEDQETYCPEELSFLGGGSSFILEMATGGLGSCSEEELEVSVGQIESMVSAATGELQHRFTYSQWTDVIGALIALRVIRDKEPVNLIEEILAADVVTVLVKGRTVPKAVDHGLRRLLTRVVSRYLE